MVNWGTVPSGSVLPFPFDSFDGGTGASITLTGLAVTDVEIYKGTSMTQRASDAGVVLLDTDGIDIDGTTGIHGFSIDTGDNTDAGFYAVGSFFYVVVSAVTIDAQTVNFVAGTFRLSAAEAVSGKPKVDVDAWLGTAAATPTVAGVPEVDLTHVAGATTNVAALATNVDAILTDTGTTLQGELDAIQAAVITNAAGVDIAADIIALKAETAAILADTAEIGAAGAGLTAINLPDQTMNITGNVTGNISGSVGSVTGAVGSVTGDVGGNVTGTVAGVTPSTAAQVAAILTTQITESYRANAAAPTLAQFMSEVLAHLGEVSISGTTKTINQLDHVTAAATLTLDDATTPAAITRAT